LDIFHFKEQSQFFTSLIIEPGNFEGMYEKELVVVVVVVVG